MPRFRFTIRRMMVVVAILGLSIWAWRLRQKSLMCRAIAETHAFWEDRWRQWASVDHVWATTASRRASQWEEIPFFQGVANDLRRESAKSQVAASHAGLQSAYFRSLRVKYERAARYPWLPVEPDPPMPE